MTKKRRSKTNQMCPCSHAVHPLLQVLMFPAQHNISFVLRFRPELTKLTSVASIYSDASRRINWREDRSWSTSKVHVMGVHPYAYHEPKDPTQRRSIRRSIYITPAYVSHSRLGGGEDEYMWLWTPTAVGGGRRQGLDSLRWLSLC